MSDTIVKITLLAPGYPGVADGGGDQARVAVLAEDVLHWHDTLTPEPWQARLSVLTGQVHWSGQHLPAARLLAGRPSDVPLVCADPVHLRADRDTATLLPPDMLSLRDSESDELMTAINEFLREDGLKLSRDGATGWIMSGRDAGSLASYPPSFLAHRNASAFLSEDASSGSWRRLMTELQMLLHSHPVNRERELRGRLPVNGIWFWGGASLDQTRRLTETQKQDLKIVSDEPYARALAAHLQVGCDSFADFRTDTHHRHTVIIDTRLSHAFNDNDRHALETVERDIRDRLIAPLVRRIQAGDGLQLEVFNEDGLQGRLDASVLEQQALRHDSMSTGSTATGRLVGVLAGAWQRLTGKY